MPITSSAKKAVRQAKTRTERRLPYKTRLKSVIKKVLDLSKSDKAAAEKAMQEAYKVIDLAAKKNIIHKNNAARKKSRLAKVVAGKVGAATTAKSKHTKKSSKKA